MRALKVWCQCCTTETCKACKSRSIQSFSGHLVNYLWGILIRHLMIGLWWNQRSVHALCFCFWHLIVLHWEEITLKFKDRLVLMHLSWYKQWHLMLIHWIIGDDFLVCLFMFSFFLWGKGLWKYLLKCG